MGEQRGPNEARTTLQSNIPGKRTVLASVPMLCNASEIINLTEGYVWLLVAEDQSMVTLLCCFGPKGKVNHGGGAG